MMKKHDRETASSRFAFATKNLNLKLRKQIERLLGIQGFLYTFNRNICVVTNDKFYTQFMRWKESLASSLKDLVHICTDHSRSNETRLGAVTDLQLAVEVLQEETPTLVIAGDTIFSPQFNLRQFLQRYTEVGGQ